MANQMSVYALYVLAYATREARAYGDFAATLASAIGLLHARKEVEMMMPSALAAYMCEMGAEQPDGCDSLRRELEQAKEALEHARRLVDELTERERETRAALDADPAETTPAAARRVASAVPDVGPTDRDRREAQAARERLQRLILAGGETDTGGRSLYESAADEIVRLRGEVDKLTAHVPMVAKAAHARGAAEMRDRAAGWCDAQAERERAQGRFAAASNFWVAYHQIRMLPLSPGGDVVTVEQQREIDRTAKARAAGGLSAEDAETLRGAGFVEKSRGTWEVPATVGGLVALRWIAAGIRAEKGPAAAHGAPGRVSGERSTAAGESSVSEEAPRAQGVMPGPRASWDDRRPGMMTVNGNACACPGVEDPRRGSTVGVCKACGRWRSVGPAPQDPKRDGEAEASAPAAEDLSEPTARDAVAGMIFRYGWENTGAELGEGAIDAASAIERIRSSVAGGDPKAKPCIAALEALARGELRGARDHEDLMKAIDRLTREVKERSDEVVRWCGRHNDMERQRDEARAEAAALRDALTRDAGRDATLLSALRREYQADGADEPTDRSERWAARMRLIRARLDSERLVAPFARGYLHGCRDTWGSAEVDVIRERRAAPAHEAPPLRPAEDIAREMVKDPLFGGVGYSFYVFPGGRLHSVGRRESREESESDVAAVRDLVASVANRVRAEMWERYQRHMMGRAKDKRAATEARAEAAALRDRVAELEATCDRAWDALGSIRTGEDLADVVARRLEERDEAPPAMRIERRADGEWLVGAGAVNKCTNEYVDADGANWPCHYHLNGEHLCTCDTADDGAERIARRWPIASAQDEQCGGVDADEVSGVRVASPGANDLHLWDVSKDHRVDLLIAKGADPRDALATVAELLGLPPPEYEIARAAAQAHERGADEGERRARERHAEPAPGAPDREELGRAVHEVWRAAWVACGFGMSARSWEECTEEDHEVDRRIGERLFAMGVEEGERRRREYGLAAIRTLAELQERETAWSHVTGASNPEDVRRAFLATGRTMIERAHANGIVEGLCRADGIIRSFVRKGELGADEHGAIEMALDNAIAEVGSATRQPHVDRASLLALAEGWETQYGSWYASAQALGDRGLVLKARAAGLETAAMELRRLLDVPRGPGGGEREPAAPSSPTSDVGGAAAPRGDGGVDRARDALQSEAREFLVSKDPALRAEGRALRRAARLIESMRDARLVLATIGFVDGAIDRVLGTPADTAQDVEPTSSTPGPESQDGSSVDQGDPAKAETIPPSAPPVDCPGAHEMMDVLGSTCSLCGRRSKQPEAPSSPTPHEVGAGPTVARRRPPEPSAMNRLAGRAAESVETPPSDTAATPLARAVEALRLAAFGATADKLEDGDISPEQAIERVRSYGSCVGSVERNVIAALEALCAAPAEEPTAARKDWNRCPRCKNLVDADDVHDGSEVRCHGCKLTLVCTSMTDGTWALVEAEEEPPSDPLDPATPEDEVARQARELGLDPDALIARGADVARAAKAAADDPLDPYRAKASPEQRAVCPNPDCIHDAWTMRPRLTCACGAELAPLGVVGADPPPKPVAVEPYQVWRCVGIDGEILVRSRLTFEGASPEIGLADPSDPYTTTVRAREADMLGLPEWSYVRGPAAREHEAEQGAIVDRMARMLRERGSR